MQRRKPTATHTPASDMPQLLSERSTWFEHPKEPLPHKTKDGGTSWKPRPCRRALPFTPLMADLTVFISFPHPLFHPAWGLGCHHPGDGDMTSLCLQQVCRVVLWSPWQCPLCPLSPAVQSRDHLQGSSSAPGRPGETSTFTEFPASLWASRDPREPSPALRVNS